MESSILLAFFDKYYSNGRNEQWYPVPNIDGLFITESGTAGKFDPKRNRIKIIHPTWTTKLYWVVAYKGTQYRLHRLVGLTFIPNPESKPDINHLDGNKWNNHKSNLEWCTNEENQLHAYQVLGHQFQANKRKVEIYKEGVLVTTTESVRKAAKFVNGASTNVSKCCAGIRKSHNGYTFKYSNY